MYMMSYRVYFGGNSNECSIEFAYILLYFHSIVWKLIVLAFWCVTHEQDTCCELFNLHNNLINFPRAKTKSKLYERNNSIISAHFCGGFNASPALFLCFSLFLVIKCRTLYSFCSSTSQIHSDTSKTFEHEMRLCFSIERASSSATFITNKICVKIYIFIIWIYLQYFGKTFFPLHFPNK